MWEGKGGYSRGDEVSEDAEGDGVDGEESGARPRAGERDGVGYVDLEEGDGDEFGNKGVHVGTTGKGYFVFVGGHEREIGRDSDTGEEGTGRFEGIRGGDSRGAGGRGIASYYVQEGGGERRFTRRGASRGGRGGGGCRQPCYPALHRLPPEMFSLIFKVKKGNQHAR